VGPHHGEKKEGKENWEIIGNSQEGEVKFTRKIGESPLVRSGWEQLID